MSALATPYAVSDFIQGLLLSATNLVCLQLRPHQAALTITVHEAFVEAREALITCPQFVARFLPLLRAALFRAQAQGQALACDAYWLRCQVNTHFLAGEVDHYFAQSLALLDKDAVLEGFYQDRRWHCAVLTLGSHQVHIHGSPSLQQAKEGRYVLKPFISRLQSSEALVLLQRELQWDRTPTRPWVVYNSTLFEPIRLRRKLRLLTTQ